MTVPSHGFRLRYMVALSALLALSGCTSLTPTCPGTADIKPEQLHGIWTVQLSGSDTRWTLRLGPHPEHVGSLRGELTQGGLSYPVVGDLEDGEFTLEESHDGKRIAATWLGELVPGSCGRALQGERIEPNQHRQVFRMQP